MKKSINMSTWKGQVLKVLNFGRLAVILFNDYQKIKNSKLCLGTGLISQRTIIMLKVLSLTFIPKCTLKLSGVFYSGIRPV